MRTSSIRRLTALAALLLAFGGLAAAAPPAVPAPIAATKSEATLDPGLLQLHGEYQTYQNQVQSGAASGPFRPTTPLARAVGDRVIIDAIAEDDPQALLADLQALGLEHGAVAAHLVSGALPIAAIPQLTGLASLNHARLAAATTSVGSVTSQADAAIGAATARTTFDLDGTGVTIGTLSDSYDCDTAASTTAAQDIASGDLPALANIQILLDYTQTDCIDEGRAMMQLIYDLAPGAKQQFHTAFLGQASFAQGIVALADAGSTVIVDDIIYFAEPMFQDGVIAKAVDNVAARGVLYFSSAGNGGRAAYRSTFRLGGQIAVSGAQRNAHDFNPGAGIDTAQRLIIPAFGQAILVFQWDDAFRSVSGAPGAAHDLDIIFTKPAGSQAQILQQGSTISLGKDPVEIAVVSNNTLTNQAVDVSIVDRLNMGATSQRQVQYVIFGDAIFSEYNTSSSTLYGHANARGAVAVGAAAFYETPAFGQSPPLLEPFSSGGTTPIYISATGTRLATPEVRPKPEIVAADGTNTTFFGNDIPQDADTFPNFFGTSAAAPHAAAVAALLREAYPQLTRTGALRLLQGTAIDMGRPGFDEDSGAGLIRADKALEQLTVADLRVTGQAKVNLPSPQLTYSLSLTNLGLGVATSVVLTQTLPVEAGLLSTQASAGTCSVKDGQVVCAVGDIGASTTVTVTVRVSTPTKGVLTSSVTATATGSDPAPSNNIATFTTQVYGKYYLPVIVR